LGRVQKVFDEMNVVGIDLIALAKGRAKKRPGWETAWKEDAQLTDERIFLPGQPEPITLDQRSPALFLLMRIRDEAHRFAITFHRKQKRKSNLHSTLDDVPGIGPKKKRALIKRFGSPKGVKLATLEELRAVEGVTEKLAASIYELFTPEREAVAAREREKAAGDSAAN
jgi:excinuclease ABC subunit C